MKKILIGSYVLIIIGIIVVIGNSDLFNKKDSKAVAAGEKVYNKQCLICHSETGKGEGKNAGTALNNQNFLSTVTNTDLYNYVKYGRDGTAMPAYGPRVSEKDLQNLVVFIRNWQTKVIEFDVPKTISGNLYNGEKQYTLYCSNCHGKEGVGMLKMGSSLANPQYLKYTADKQIWISAAYGREETRMGSSLKGLDGVRQLKKDDITDIVSYIRSLKVKKEIKSDYLEP